MSEAIVLVLIAISATYLLDYLLNRSHSKGSARSRGQFVADIRAHLQGIAGFPLILSTFVGFVYWLMVQLGKGAAGALLGITWELRATSIAFLMSAAIALPVCYAVCSYLVHSMRNLLEQMK